jgi:catecholate siderophore receptor
MHTQTRTNVLTAALVALFLVTQATFAYAADTDSTNALPEVVVTGKENRRSGSYNPDSNQVPKYQEPLSDIPQSITVVPAQVMQDQGATTLRDSLRNISGLSMSAGEGGAQGDSMTLRGFSARSDLYLDGMRDFGSYYRDPFNLESVDALKGSSSILFGRGSTGGVINQVSKTPHLEAETTGTLMVGSDQTRRATLDATRPIDDHSAFRLNLMGHQNNVAERDITENRRFGIAPSIAFGLETKTRFVVSYLNQSSNDTPDYGIPFLLSRPAPMDRKNYYGFKDGNFLDTNIDVFTAKIEHDLEKDVLIRNQFRYGNYSRNLRITEAAIAGSPTAATPIDTILVDRKQIAVSSTEKTIDNDLSLSAKFKTGFIHHTFISGVEVIHESSEPTRYSFTGVPQTGLSNPDTSQPFSGTSTISSRTKGTVLTMAGYVMDTLKFSEQWGVAGGLRFDRLVGRYESYVGTSAGILTRNDNLLSWRGSLIFKPVSATTLYFSYGTAFNPSIEQISLAANTANLDPEKNQTYEVGGKFDLMDGRLTLQSAIFRVEKSNARTPDPVDPTLYVLSGRHRVDGFEFSATGNLTKRLQIFGGYTYMYGRIIETNRAGEQGNLLSNVPRHTVNLWTTYGLTDAWNVGAGMNAVTTRVNSTTPDAATGLIREVDGYITLNAMTKYRLSKEVEMQLNLYNLANSYYFDSVHPGHLVPEAGRSVLLSTNLRL